jgi:hypothetical protein
MGNRYRISCIVKQTQGMFAGLNTEHDLGIFEADSTEEAKIKAREELSKHPVEVLEIHVCD